MTKNNFYAQQLNEILISQDLKSCTNIELIKIAFRSGWNSCEKFYGYELHKIPDTEKLMKIDIDAKPENLKSHLFDPS